MTMRMLVASVDTEFGVDLLKELRAMAERRGKPVDIVLLEDSAGSSDSARTLQEVLRAILGEFVRRRVASPLPAEAAEDQLTRREREILDLTGAGLSNKEIARRLGISSATVKTHLHRVYVKLRSSGRFKAFLQQSTVDALSAPDLLSEAPS